jgi:hypothetical protein
MHGACVLGVSVRGVCVRGMCDSAYVCARLTYVWACSDVPAGSAGFLVLASVGMASVCFACECAACVGARDVRCSLVNVCERLALCGGWLDARCMRVRGAPICGQGECMLRV